MRRSESPRDEDELRPPRGGKIAGALAVLPPTMTQDPSSPLGTDPRIKQWLVRVDGEVVGPVSLDQLMRGHSVGTLPEDAEVAHVERRQWWTLEPAFWDRLAARDPRGSGVRPLVEAPDLPAPATPRFVAPAEERAATWSGHTICGPLAHARLAKAQPAPAPAPHAPPAATADLPDFEEEPVELPTQSFLEALLG